ncbi:hypothetical protein [Metamycoplasma neophronis]|uniref:Variable surface lipoprotein n=1 Tax=Metamycoplasma neophronis TaxID=872983 RepID=A0ABY2Z4B5_9BACT|nr:hypothetical protein [Metamycoplasma neophronis]TPR54115.1 hypothetical protein FJR74_01595 [Metamycoplasma neophronis]
MKIKHYITMGTIIALPFLAISCNAKNNNNSNKTEFNINTKDEINTNNKFKEDVNRDNGLIGTELRAAVDNAIKNSTFTMTDFANNDYNSLSTIEKDEYVKTMWKNIQKWFKDTLDYAGRPTFYAETLDNPEFSKYFKIFIPDLSYFRNNHEFHCYFGYDPQKRDLFYYFKIKCLDGKQTEGHQTVYLQLPGLDNED